MGLYKIGRMDGSNRLCAALHMEGVDPQEIEVCLPYSAWWKLWARLERQFPGVMRFDGRGAVPTSFKWMGVTYKVKQ